jgi:hypothetical protein
MQLGERHMNHARKIAHQSHWNGIAGRMWCEQTGTLLDVKRKKQNLTPQNNHPFQELKGGTQKNEKGK